LLKTPTQMRFAWPLTVPSVAPDGTEIDSAAVCSITA